MFFSPPNVPSIDVQDAYEKISKGEVEYLLDVRTPGEFERGALKNSVNIPLDAFEGQIEKVVQNKDATVLVYCLSGSRSVFAVQIMQQMGYTNVFDISNGLLAWRTKKLPL